MPEAGTVFIAPIIGGGWAVHVQRERTGQPDLSRTYTRERQAWRYAERLTRQRGWQVVWLRRIDGGLHA